MSDSIESRMYIGLDVGGTFLKAARLDGAGNVARQIHEPIQKDTPDKLFEQLEAAVRSLAGTDEPADVVTAVGIGLPGIVDQGTGCMRNSPNVGVLNGMCVGEEMLQRTGVVSYAENDANAAALAEAYRGAGRGAENVLFVTLGTGVGAGVILGGKIWSGKSGYAGEIGHIQVVPDGVTCGCGSWGCLETVVGVNGWVRRAQELIATKPSALKDKEITPASIAEAAFDDDAVALEVVDGAARALAVGIAASLNLLNIERVVIGGGIANAGPLLLDRVIAETKKRTFPQVFADCSFRQAELGSDAGVLGAACVAMLCSEQMGGKK